MLRTATALTLLLLSGCAGVTGTVGLWTAERVAADAIDSARRLMVEDDSCRAAFVVLVGEDGLESMIRQVQFRLWAFTVYVPVEVDGEHVRSVYRHTWGQSRGGVVDLNLLVFGVMRQDAATGVVVHEYGHEAGLKDARPVELACMGVALSDSP